MKDPATQNAGFRREQPDMFSKQVTLFVKAIAAIALLWHHFFMYSTQFPYARIVARHCKFCIAIYVMLAGYGAAASLGGGKSARQFLAHRLSRFYPSYWLIFVIFVFTSIVFFGLTPNVVFPHGHAIGYMLIEFFGFIGYFGPGTAYNSPAWFVGTIVILWATAPLLWKISHRGITARFIALIAAFCCIFAPGNGNLTLWALPFYMGMLAFQFRVPGKIQEILQTKPKWMVYPAFTIALFAAMYFRHHFPLEAFRNTRFDSVIAVAICLFGQYAYYDAPEFVRNHALSIGTHSMSLFLTHAFIIRFWGDALFVTGIPIIDFLVFFAICYTICIALDYIQPKLIPALHPRSDNGLRNNRA